MKSRSSPWGGVVGGGGRGVRSRAGAVLASFSYFYTCGLSCSVLFFSAHCFWTGVSSWNQALVGPGLALVHSEACVAGGRPSPLRQWFFAALRPGALPVPFVFLAKGLQMAQVGWLLLFRRARGF